jgi:carboxynorspermidine decarboxylase
MYSTFDICKEYLKGCCASGLHEALLSNEEFGGETHTYSPSFKQEEFEQIVKISNHIIFNSINELNKHEDKILPSSSIGLRVNPQCSTVEVDLYNPCAIYSRLGIIKENMPTSLPKIIKGLHFHALCEQNVDALKVVLDKFERDFSCYFPSLEWVNFGGGHHITREDYDIDGLIKLLNSFSNRYKHLKIYIELGEAVGWQTGYLEATVMDIVHNGIDIAILDTSAECHMPDTLAMPYTPMVENATIVEKISNQKNLYRLAGNSCLAGDIIGDYSFDYPLKVGDKIKLLDMMHYTMVKTTTFNGINLPAIAIERLDGTIEIQKTFGYQEYKSRI